MKQITKQSTVRKFKVGDLVTFNVPTMYGVIGKIHKGVITVGTETDTWEANEDELKHYTDPFAWWWEAE